MAKEVAKASFIRDNSCEDGGSANVSCHPKKFSKFPSSTHCFKPSGILALRLILTVFGIS